MAAREAEVDGDGRLRVGLPSGATFPDWSAIGSDQAAAALGAILEAFGAGKCWAGLGAGEDRVRRAVLTHYGKTGHAPDLAQLAEATEFDQRDLRELLARLKARDIVVLDADGTSIVGAYPFTERDTGHRVGLGATTLNAMCAIDALGAGAMYGADAIIHSACRQCGAAIEIATGRRGRTIASFSPDGAVVWSGIRDSEGCAADSLCTVLAFFCSDAHLESWRDANHPEIEGFRLTLDEGMQAGRAIFAPMLARGRDISANERTNHGR